MKRFYGFILLSVMLLSLTTCNNNEKQEEGYICKYFIWGLYNPVGAHLIEVTDSGVVTISSGSISDDFYDKVLYEDKEMTESLYDYKFFKEIRIKETVRLTHAELERLKKCVSKIENVKLVNPYTMYGGCKDREEHIVIVGKNKNVFVWIPSEDFSEFLKTLLELTHREWTNIYGKKIKLDYDERYVDDCQRPDTTSYWVKIKKWFE